MRGITITLPRATLPPNNFALQKFPALTFSLTKLSIISCIKYLLKLPCTFRGVSSLTDVAHAPYIADILTPYQIKAFKMCYKKIALVFDSNESASFLRPIYEDVMIAFHEL